MAPYFTKHGYCVRAVNFLDMAHSDGWNCLYSLDQETQLVQTVANTIIQNTSGPKEADDFWSRAELNLLMALIHYVCNLKDANGKLLPIEQRGLGDVYQLLANKSIQEINRTLAQLPPEHPAKGHHGLFLKARENLWGNIAIGLGNRLAIFQNKLVDTITRNHDVDLVLPGQKPCAYFVIISAQDSAYRFLSSLFFSLALPRLSDYARLKGKGGRLPVLVNFCLDEYCNIGYMDGIADALNSIRGFNMSCQIVVQSLSQWQEKYPGKEWENQLATFDQTLYSQTRSNTQRELMQPDEILRLDRSQCIALFQGHKPALLYKLAPEELPDYGSLKSRRVVKYIPKWKRREQQAQKKKAASKQTKPAERAPKEQLPPKEKVNPAQDLEYNIEDTKQETAGGIGLIDLGDVVGDDEPDEEADSPPGR